MLLNQAKTADTLYPEKVRITWDKNNRIKRSRRHWQGKFYQKKIL